jgi:hypothetical protein
MNIPETTNIDFLVIVFNEDNGREIRLQLLQRSKHITHTKQLQKYNLIKKLMRMNNMKQIKEIGLQ